MLWRINWEWIQFNNTFLLDCGACFQSIVHYSLFKVLKNINKVLLFCLLKPEIVIIMAGLLVVDRAANQLKSLSTGAEQSRGREGPALQYSWNMAGRGGNLMCSWSGSAASEQTCSAASEEQKPKKRSKAFSLTRMKSRNITGKQLKHQPAVHNNNMPFTIHCQIGKEIKHICSNCRGAEQRHGERTLFSWLGERGMLGGGVFYCTI